MNKNSHITGPLKEHMELYELRNIDRKEEFRGRQVRRVIAFLERLPVKVTTMPELAAVIAALPQRAPGTRTSPPRPRQSAAGGHGGASPQRATTIAKVHKVAGLGEQDVRRLNAFRPALRPDMSAWKYISEILNTGRTIRAARLSQDPKILAYRDLTRVHGIGLATARELYSKEGITGVGDLRRRLAENPNLTAIGKVGISLQVKLSLPYVEDMQLRIPREEIADCDEAIRLAAQALWPGVTGVTCGSYRRGKALCGDMDFLITHDTLAQQRPLPIGPLLLQLCRRGWKLVTLAGDTVVPTLERPRRAAAGPGNEDAVVFAAAADGGGRSELRVTKDEEEDDEEEEGEATGDRGQSDDFVLGKAIQAWPKRLGKSKQADARQVFEASEGLELWMGIARPPFTPRYVRRLLVQGLHAAGGVSRNRLRARIGLPSLPLVPLTEGAGSAGLQSQLRGAVRRRGHSVDSADGETQRDSACSVGDMEALRRVDSVDAEEHRVLARSTRQLRRAEVLGSKRQRPAQAIVDLDRPSTLSILGRHDESEACDRPGGALKGAVGAHRLSGMELVQHISGFVGTPHRRLDLKSFVRRCWAFALLEFTGSGHFNRSMRLYTRNAGWSLSNRGLSPVVRDGHHEREMAFRSVPCATERDIFEALGLHYLDPCDRNPDVPPEEEGLGELGGDRQPAKP